MVVHRSTMWLLTGFLGAQHEVVEPSPFLASLSAMAFDAARGVAIHFGGGGSGLVSDLTFAWNGSTWRQLHPARRPPARSSHAMAYDRLRQRVVLFGGANSGSVLGDTWEWDGGNWLQIPVAGPVARLRSGMVFDSVRNRVLLFGGTPSVTRFGGAFDDAWTYDGFSWSSIALPNPRPFARCGHAMAFDQARGTVVLYGGESYSNLPSSEVWEFNGATLTRINVPGPAPRLDAALVDVPGPGVLLHGGEVFGPGVSDSWLWNGATWSPIAVPAAPMANAASCFDSARGEALVLGGGAVSPRSPGDLSLWAFNGVWAERAPIPGGAFVMLLSYDVARQQVLCFDTVAGSVLLGSAGGWTRLPPMVTPSSRSGARMVYDRSRQSVVLFGGRGSSPLADTWEWNGNSWLQRQPVQTPPARWLHAMAYDRARNRVVVFGGWVGSATGNDTWEYDGSTWLLRTTAVAPGPRGAAAMGYDVRSGVIVLYGGNDGVFPALTDYSDTWTWDGANWRSLATTANARFRSHLQLIEDDDRGQVVIVGGSHYPQAMNLETWDFDGNGWQLRTTWPGMNSICGAAYDVARGRIVASVYGQGTVELALPAASLAGSGNNVQLSHQGRPALGRQVQLSLGSPGFFVAALTTASVPGLPVSGAAWCGTPTVFVDPAQSQVLGYGTSLQLAVPNLAAFVHQPVCAQAVAFNGSCLDLSNAWVFRIQER